MKSSMRMSFQIIILFLSCAVSGAVTDEKSVSVNEGEAVTLHTDVTGLQDSDKIRWRFGEEGSATLIAEMSGGTIRYRDLDDGRFKYRLQILDLQTGDLIIKNMRHKHSGRYKVDFESKFGTTTKIFRVTVNDTPHVIGADKMEEKIALKEGDSVTLHTDISELRRDCLTVWRFGDDGVIIAKYDKEDSKISIYEDAEGKFRDRLKLDHRTGDLTISDVKATDAGVYKLKVINNKETKYKTFILSFKCVSCCDSVEALMRLVVTAVMGVAAVAAVVVLVYDIRSRRGSHQQHQ